MRLKVLLYPSDEGYAVSAPSLPGCWSQGATREEALENIADAVREYLDADVGQPDGAEVREIEVPA
jgi:predicted RNase H-like HicB family nuclease